MNWITLFFIIELGLNPFKGTITSYENTQDLYIEEMSTYIQLETEVELLDYFFIGGMIKTDMLINQERLSFRPELSSYLFKAGVRFKMLEIGFRHICIHPTMPYYLQFQPITTYDAAYEEIYIRISNGF